MTNDGPIVQKYALYMMLYALIYTGLWVVARSLSTELHPFVLVFFRTLIGFIIITPMVMKKDIGALKTEQHKLYFLRAVLSISAIFFTFYALSHIPLVDAVAYSYLTPLFATLMSYIFLKDRLSKKQMVVIGISFLATLIILRPGFNEFNMGMAASIVGSFCFAGTLLTMKLLTNKDKPGVVTVYGFMQALPLAFIAALFVWTWPPIELLPMIVLMGILSVAAQFCMSKALSLAEMSKVLPFDFTRLIYAAAFGVLLFGDQIDYLTIFGGVIILACSVYSNILGHAKADK